MKCVRQLLVVTSAVVLAAGCSSDDDDASSEATTATSADPTTVAEPASTEPAATEPATTEPATTEPATTEPASTDPLEITTSSGPVRGADSAVAGVRAFLTIPYAAPPVGELRWRPPQPVEGWQQPRDATAPGAACPQSTEGVTAAVTVIPPGNEDCLTLSVWTPTRRRRAAGDGLVPRRWAQRRVGAPAVVHRRSPGGAWRRGGQRQLPPRRAGVPRRRRAGRRAGWLVRQLRARRPDRRPAVGRRQRRAVRWRRRQRHDLRRVGGRVVGVRPPRVDRVRRPVRPGDRPERRRMRPAPTCRTRPPPRARRSSMPPGAATRPAFVRCRSSRSSPHRSRRRSSPTARTSRRPRSTRPLAGEPPAAPVLIGSNADEATLFTIGAPEPTEADLLGSAAQTGGDAASVLALYPPEQFADRSRPTAGAVHRHRLRLPDPGVRRSRPVLVRLPLHLRLAIQPVRARRHPRRRAGAPLRPPGGHPGPSDAVRRDDRPRVRRDPAGMGRLRHDRRPGLGPVRRAGRSCSSTTRCKPPTSSATVAAPRSPSSHRDGIDEARAPSYVRLLTLRPAWRPPWRLVHPLSPTWLRSASATASS